MDATLSPSLYRATPLAGPFCHRALLTLEEKHIPYKKTYIDFSNKPQWLLDVNPAGSVPVMKDLATGEWTVDSGVIADMLEQRFPEVSLGTVEGSPQVGGAIFGAFRDFAKAEGPEDSAAKEAALVQALEELDTYLQKHGPYIGGDKPCATDVSLMPKLYHMETALEHFRVSITGKAVESFTSPVHGVEKPHTGFFLARSDFMFLLYGNMNAVFCVLTWVCFACAGVEDAGAPEGSRCLHGRIQGARQLEKHPLLH